MIENCIFASMKRYTVRQSALNHFDMIILTITKEWDHTYGLFN